MERRNLVPLLLRGTPPSRLIFLLFFFPNQDISRVETYSKVLFEQILTRKFPRYIDPAESGAVIPIVHVNGFKISERTIYGCMDDKEMVSLFTGYGYQCRFVEDLEDIVSGNGN